MLLREKERSRSAPARIAALTITVIALASVCITVLGATTAQAQSQPAGVFKVNYFTQFDDTQERGTVRITNPGSTTGGLIPPQPAPVCALIYVYRPDEQLGECCGCRVSRNALRTIPVWPFLTNNPFTADPITTGVIKIVSSFRTNGQPPDTDAQCNDTARDGMNPARTVRAWGTHLQITSPGRFGIATETEFSDAQLSDEERGVLDDDCSHLFFLGSGHGICNCPPPPGP